MRHPEGPRKDRRLRARQEARRLAEEEANKSNPPPEIPRQERRVRSMTPGEVDDWLKKNGVSTGDRRRR